MARRALCGSALSATLTILIAATAHPAAHAQDTLDAAHDRQARALFEAGREAHAAGEYEQALGFFQQSYDLSHRTELLFNIAQSADRARHDRVALEAYEQFLQLMPDTPQRTLIEGRMAFLRRQLEQPSELAEDPEGGASEEAAAEPAAAEDEPPDELLGPVEEAPATTGGDSTAGWVLIGVSAAVAVTGAVLIGIGLSDRARVETAPDLARWAEYEAAFSRAEPLTIAGIVLAGVGLVGTAIGIVLVTTTGRGGSTQVGVGPGSVRIRGSF